MLWKGSKSKVMDLMRQVKMCSQLDLVEDKDGSNIHIIPDVHGSRAMLRVALQHVEDFPLAKNDKIGVMGNFIGEHGSTKDVISLLRAYEAMRPHQLVVLRGHNEHELLLTKKKFFSKGLGLKIINHYRRHPNAAGPLMNEIDMTQLWSDISWLANKPAFHVSHNHIFVHSGLAPSVALPKQDTHTCLYIQNKFHKSQRIWYKDGALGEKVPLKVVHSNTGEGFKSCSPTFLLNRMDIGSVVDPGQEISVISIGDSGKNLTKKPELFKIWMKR